MRLLRRFALLGLLTAVPPSDVMAQVPVFFQIDFPGGARVRELTTGDFNLDTHPDVAVAVPAPGDLAVLLGNGSGSFTSKLSFTAYQYAGAIAAADFNGDTYPDLALTSFADSVVTLMANDGSGQFDHYTQLQVPSYSMCVAVGDVDGSGLPDLIVGPDQRSVVSVFFDSQVRLDIPSGHPLRDVVLADVDGDSDLDIVGVSGSSALTVLLNQGSGTFGPPTDFSLPSYGNGVAVAEMDGDGKLDVLVLTGTPNVVVVKGNGLGGFSSTVSVPVGSGAISMVVGDLNGDGDIDVATANTSGSISLVVGDGMGGLSAATNLAVAPSPYAVTAADMNHDGRLDLIYGTSSTNTIVVLLQVSSSSTSLLSAPQPSLYRQTVTLTAQVTPSSATGQVSFRDGATPIGTAPVIAGQAVMMTDSLSIGSHSLTAVYSGDIATGSSTSPPLVHGVSPLISSALTLDTPPSPSVAGASVDLTVHVSPSDATGTVYFFDDNAFIGSADLESGSATLVASLCGASHSFRAHYLGGPLHFGSLSNVVSHSVVPASTSLQLHVTPNPARLPEVVTYTATVSSSSTPACPITGTIQLFENGTQFHSAVVDNGVATLYQGGLVEGTHRIIAVYSGSENATQAISDTLLLEVTSARPRLVSVRDVLNDQGGKVKLQWLASDLDLPPYNQVEAYWVLRSVPAAAVSTARRRSALQLDEVEAGDPDRGSLFSPRALGDYFWEFVASQPAFHVPQYSFVAATTSDSMAGTNPLTAFMIMARSPGGGSYWFSNPDSGYSVDNLPPAAPQLFQSYSSSGGTTLTWNPGPDPDLSSYRLYRGTSPDFPTDVVHQRAVVHGTSYFDPGLAPPWYKLTAVDSHGNEGPAAAWFAGGLANAPWGDPNRLALHSVRPNPIRIGSDLVLWVTLLDDRPTRLSLFDASGRSMASKDIGTLGEGTHAVRLGTGSLPPGAYLANLKQGDKSIVRRLIVVR